MVHWLVQTAQAHDALALAQAPEGLLSAAERERLAQLRSPKRRRDWLLGRWTAKQLIRSVVEREHGQAVALDALTIASAPDGAPEVRVADGAPLCAWLAGSRAVGGAPGRDARCAVSLSISHSHDRALCALLDGADTAVGCDIERVEARAPLFALDYFTDDELAHLYNAPPEQHDTLVAAIWSAKEAALKALRLGLTVDTRAVTCVPHESAAPESDPAPGWGRVSVTSDPRLLGREAPALRGWWRAEGGFVLTLAVAGPA